MFKQFPDVLTVAQLQQALPVGKNKFYELLGTKLIKSIRVGRKILIPKKALIDFARNGVANSLGSPKQVGPALMTESSTIMRSAWQNVD